MKEEIYDIISRVGVRILTKVFPEYFAKEPLKPTDRYIEYPFAIRNLPKSPAKVLDVGCAGSFFPLLLASFGYETYGIDIRPYAIVNEINFENFRFVKEDIRRTSFPDNFFDAITAISTVEHIGISGRYGMDEDLDGDKKTLKEMKRILKPEGIISLTVPFGKAKIMKPYMRIYDDGRLKDLTTSFIIQLEQYYMQDESDNWIKCSKESANNIEAKLDRYPLCCLRLQKIS